MVETLSEGSFFEDLLRAAGHAIITGGKVAQKRDRLQEYLTEKVEASEQNRLILFIDEAQKLQEFQYKWLIDVHNELDKSGICLIVLLVGQVELMHQYSAFIHTKKTQIIGRFMVHQIAFHGIQSLTHLTDCLDIYDENSEYPLGSNKTFTQHYYPAAFLTGWRLAHYSPDLWKAFLTIKEEQRIARAAEIPMQYFCRTVEYVLRRHGTYSDYPDPISLNIWKEAIERSGYVDLKRNILFDDMEL